MRCAIKQHQTLTIGAASPVEYSAVVARLCCGLEWKNDVLVQNIEVPIRPISHRAAVEGFRHKDKIPLMAARDIDNVFPALRRQSLTEIRAQRVDALTIEETTNGRITISRRTIHARMPCLSKPIRNVSGKVAPDVARDVIPYTIQSEVDAVPDGRAVIENITFVIEVVVVLIV